VGFAGIGNTGLAGSTSGFTYDVTSPNTDVFIYNPSVSSAVGPTAAQTTAATSIALGALIAASGSTTAPTTTASTWDTVSGGSIPLNINDATTTSGTTTNTSYIYGNLLFGGTAPIEQIKTTSSGTSVSYLVSNQTGVQGVYSGGTGSLGAVQEMAIYSVYGNQTLSSGTKVTPFGFQGSYTDSTGLIYLVNRYYDPTTDQFLSIDPKVATTNQPYVFTNDNPLNSTDPLGLCNRDSHGRCMVSGSRTIVTTSTDTEYTFFPPFKVTTTKTVVTTTWSWSGSKVTKVQATNKGSNSWFGYPVQGSYTEIKVSGNTGKVTAISGFVNMAGDKGGNSGYNMCTIVTVKAGGAHSSRSWNQGVGNFNFGGDMGTGPQCAG
jgi:RHS repeat-associated protein